MTPKGGRDRIDGWTVDANGKRLLKVRVSAPPEKGKANQSLLALLARELHIPKSAIVIASGETARLKLVRIAGDVAVQLEAFGEAK